MGNMQPAKPCNRVSVPLVSLVSSVSNLIKTPTAVNGHAAVRNTGMMMFKLESHSQCQGHPIRFVPHTCSYCGFNYVPDNPEDRARHNSYHTEARMVIDPEAEPRFQLELEHGYAQLVFNSSQPWKHEEMYMRGRQLIRELKCFDCVPWGSPWGHDDPDHIGILLNDLTNTFPYGTIVGACAFCWRDTHWALQWVWICPKARRIGVLKKWWYVFRKIFGENFEVDEPLSDAMAAFLRKHGSAEQQAWAAFSTQRLEVQLKTMPTGTGGIRAVVDVRAPTKATTNITKQ